jgi:tetratricopeptide (TPR) repeat protein
MPFQNMTNDIKLNNWQGGIQDNLINVLTNSEELNVKQSESVNALLQSQGITNYASITPSVAGKISVKLDANVFIFGSINQSGSTIRVNAQLTDSKTGEILKSFKKEGSFKDGSMFPIIDPMSEEIKNYLIISGLREEAYIDPQRTGSSDNPEAYRYFTFGQKDFANGDFPEAINMLSQAVKIDSNLAYAVLLIGWAYLNQGLYNEAKKWCLKAYYKRDAMSIQLKTYTNYVYAYIFGTPLEAIKYLKQLQEVDDQWPHLHYDMGNAYSILLQFEKAIPEYEKALEMYSKKDSKPWWPSNYTGLGRAYHETGQYKKEKRLYKKAEQYFPDNPAIIERQAILALTTGDQNLADEYIEKYRSIRKDNAASEADIATVLALVYSEADISDITLEYYRMALSKEPGNPSRMNSLAYFIFTTNRNIIEGMELVEKALELKPDDYDFLDTKGWGLYKQGKYQEALEVFQKSWDLRREKAIYNHVAYLHLEAAKKAVAEKK